MAKKQKPKAAEAKAQTEVVSIRLPIEMVTALKAMDMPLSNFVRYSLESVLKNHKCPVCKKPV